MLHARKDYNRIQDPENIIPAEEPVFLLRAQDLNAPMVVAYWADTAEQNGAAPEIVLSARKHAAQMLAWQARHGKKVPDLSK
jgi:hypothetical protein